MAYVNPSLTGHKTSASVDARQREYLLDMIDPLSSVHLPDSQFMEMMETTLY